MELNRTQIVNQLIRALEPLPYVHAMWEGGSAAFGRLDEYSDLDLMVDAEAEAVEQVLDTAEEALRKLSPVKLRFRLPEPTWHGHAQLFLQLQHTSPWLLIDFVVMKHGQGMRFNEIEQHGRPIVFFDKSGAVTEARLDQAQLRSLIDSRIEQLRVTVPLFRPLVSKELLRGRNLDALHFYLSLALRPLIELLRIRYCPERYSFGMRYLHTDLPRDVALQVEELALVGSADALAAKLQAAASLFEATLEELDQLKAQASA